MADAVQPKKIVYVIASMITGGTQTHLLQVLRFLDRTRHDPHLFCLRDEGNLIDAVGALDVPVQTFSMQGSLKSPGDWGGVLRMRRALADLSPSIVHAYLLRGNFFGSVAARAARVPVVITSKRGHHVPTGAAEKFAVAVSNRLSDRVTGNSPAVLEFTRKVEAGFPEPLVMIPSGIDMARFKPDATDDLRRELNLGDSPTLGTAITWRPRKGFRLLFEAFAKALTQVPQAVLLIAGVDDYDRDPGQLARSLGIESSIRLLGRRSDMPRVYKSMDAFVLPSESEGMSNAVLEAMAMRVPVVVTRVGGNPHIIDEAKTGFLVDYPDVETLADRFKTLLADAELRSRVGHAARKHVVDRYSAPAMVGHMQGLYHSLSEPLTPSVS